MEKQIFYADSENSEIKWTPEDRDRWRTMVSLLDGKKVKITLEQHRDKRSTNQNKYYWGVVLPFLLREMGDNPVDADRLHKILVNKFLVEKVEIKLKDAVSLETYNIPRSTASITIPEFQEYLMNVELWAIDFLGIKSLPDPE